MARATKKDTGKLTSVAAAAAKIDMRARAEAFGRAERHSRLVRQLKFILPVSAAIMTVAFLGVTWFAKPPMVAVQAEGTTFADGKLVMSNPKLEGFTKDGRPYTMTADRAIQFLEQQGRIDLEGISAKLPVDNDNWAQVVSKYGVYDQISETLNLTSDVLVTTTDGMVAKLVTAFLDVRQGTLKTTQPVDIQRGNSKIVADTLSILDNGKLLVFEKRVRMNIEPAEFKAANEASGGTNASN